MGRCRPQRDPGRQHGTNYLIDLYNNPNFVVDADGSGLAGMRDGSIKAMFTGSWDAAALKEILGDNMGVAALPTFTLNGVEKQMYAYAGSKAIGVNVHSKYMVQAIQLAIYLGGAEAQQLHYDLRTVIPCNTELLADPAIASDELVAAQNETFDRTSILQPFVASMSNCWTPVQGDERCHEQRRYLVRKGGFKDECYKRFENAQHPAGRQSRHLHGGPEKRRHHGQAVLRRHGPGQYGPQAGG